jgi:hypothetical protein
VTDDEPLTGDRATPEAIDALRDCASLADPLTPTRPTTSETFCAWVDEATPEIGDAPVEPVAADAFADCTSDAEPETATAPADDAAFFACVADDEPDAMTPPEAADVLAA